jgi:hypothetical protein
MTECISRRLTVWTGDCPCDRCRKQFARMRKLNDHGRYVRVSVAEGQAALDRLIEQGFTGSEIAEATGALAVTANGWVRRRKAGGTAQLGPAVCEALVKARPRHTNGDTLIAARMLRALARIGWGCKEIDTMMRKAGLNDTTSRVSLYRIRKGDLATARTSLLEAIAEIYRRLWMHPAPSDPWHNKSRKLAIRNRWASPLAWDDITCPDDRPQGVCRAKWDATRASADLDWTAVDRACSGEGRGLALTKAERVATVARLRERGLRDVEIERLTHIGRVAERYPRKLPPATEEDVPA